jgi:hypothetical protein
MQLTLGVTDCNWLWAVQFALITRNSLKIMSPKYNYFFPILINFMLNKVFWYSLDKKFFVIWKPRPEGNSYIILKYLLNVEKHLKGMVYEKVQLPESWDN